MKNKKKSLLHCAPLLFVTLITSCGAPVEKKDMPMEEKNKIQELTSGLRYEITKPAPAGAQAPKKGQEVAVHYTGWLNDGKDQLGAKFDSSVDRGQPFEFPLGAGYVIKGWDEGIALLKVGEKARLYIPAALGYGARGAGAVIPPHANLIFDVELIAVK
jgi:FKBP-type peptidyl-prolyl cis-trans isomerase